MRATRHVYEVEGWGVGELWACGSVVVQHELATPGLPPGHPREPVPELCRRLALHLEGVHVSYADVELELGWMTPFQRRLTTTLRDVPWGEVVTYGELAALAGRPGAARAAGSLCAGNRFPLIVPCHRVVAASGIGGYGEGGVALKRRLLALEGIAP